MPVASITIVLLVLIAIIALYLVRRSRKRFDQRNATLSLPEDRFEPERAFDLRTESTFTSDTEEETSTMLGSSEIANSIETQPVITEHYQTPVQVNKEPTPEELVAMYGKFDPKLDLANYHYPNLDLLDSQTETTSPLTAIELDQDKHKLVATLASYGIEIEQIKASIGPTVNLFEIVPSPGVRIQQIKKLEGDIALALAAMDTRVIGHLPGKGTVGIEVPHRRPERVTMRSLVATEAFASSDVALPLALGKTMDGKTFLLDLAQLPHLLIAGAPGQGKSVAINAVITSLLYKKHPAELKFVLIDLNHVELSTYSKIERHFLAKLPSATESVVTSSEMVGPTLQAVCLEMDTRYNLCKDAGVRQIQEYNEKFINRALNPDNGHRYLPFIIVVIDEFSEIIDAGDRITEPYITRLARLGRSVGIHLIISTRRPTVNYITGSLKGNISGRLAFRVVSTTDSNIILDTAGAERLRGDGDALFSNGVEITHIQGPLISTNETNRISDFIGYQRSYPTAFLLPVEQHFNFDPNDCDPMFEDAARLVVLHQQGSPSLIQRKLKLGYNRAGRIIDQLEAAGIVGPFEGSKAREVLYPDEYSLERHLSEYTANRVKKRR